MKRRSATKPTNGAHANDHPGILVEFYRFADDAPWIAFVRGPRGMNVYAHGDTIAQTRRRLRVEFVAVIGRERGPAIWRNRAETMPLGAEEREAQG